MRYIDFDGVVLDDEDILFRKWEEAGGLPLFFDKFETNIDSWGTENTYDFQKVCRINEEYRGKSK